MADRMAVLESGGISQLGTPRELYNRPANRFCGSFLGDINFFDGEIQNGEITTAFGKFPLAGDIEGANGAAIRPERISFVAENTPGAFAATVISGSFGGDNTQWQCEACGVKFTVLEMASPERRSGDRVYLKFAPDFLLAMK